MTKIRGKPRTYQFDLSKVTTQDHVMLENGSVCKVVSGAFLQHNDLQTISVSVSGYGTAQYYVHNGEHIFTKCPPIKSIITKGMLYD
jgi:hypothetical protein